MKPQTLFDKIWNTHLVEKQEDGTCLIYIDRHLVHEVTSPQAFEGLRSKNRKVRRPDLTLGVADHNIPTTERSLGIDSIKDSIARLQVETLEKNLKENLFIDLKNFAIDPNALSEIKLETIEKNNIIPFVLVAALHIQRYHFLRPASQCDSEHEVLARLGRREQLRQRHNQRRLLVICGHA